MVQDDHLLVGLSISEHRHRITHTQGLTVGVRHTGQVAQEARYIMAALAVIRKKVFNILIPASQAVVHILELAQPAQGVEQPRIAADLARQQLSLQAADGLLQRLGNALGRGLIQRQVGTVACVARGKRGFKVWFHRASYLTARGNRPPAE